MMAVPWKCLFTEQCVHPCAKKRLTHDAWMGTRGQIQARGSKWPEHIVLVVEFSRCKRKDLKEAHCDL